jgi:hypothetical protein
VHGITALTHVGYRFPQRSCIAFRLAKIAEISFLPNTATGRARSPFAMLSKWLLIIASGCTIILRDQSSAAPVSKPARITITPKMTPDM